MTNNTEDVIVWRSDSTATYQAKRCKKCDGIGREQIGSRIGERCEHCSGLGWFGIDPQKAITALPGSIEKIVMLSVRYRSGMSLWNEGDGPDLSDSISRPRTTIAG